MDKVLELVIAATVILMTAASIMFMMSDRSQKFNDWANNTKTDFDCDLKQTRFEQACDCDDNNGDFTTDESDNIYENAEDAGCDWPNDPSSGGAYTCGDNVCG